MSLFDEFNYDIVIVIVFAGFLIFALYFRFRRQLFFTISYIMPFVLLYFIYNPLGKIAKKTGLLQLLSKLSFSGKKEYPAVLITGVAAYVLIFVILRLMFRFFREPVERQITCKSNAYLKAANIIMGCLNGFVSVFLISYVIQPVIKINYNAPLTVVMHKTAIPVFMLSYLSEIEHAAECYRVYENAVGHLTGQKARAGYERLFTDLEKIKAENEYFRNEIYPLLSSGSRDIILHYVKDDNYLAALLLNENGRVIDRVIAIESASAPDGLASVRDFLNRYGGACRLGQFLKEESVDYHEFFAMARFLSAHAPEIIKFYPDERRDIGEAIENLSYFLQNYKSFYKEEDIELQDYTGYFSAVFTDKELLCEYGADFIEKHRNNSDPVTKDLVAIFENIITYRAEINTNIPPEITLALGPGNRRWFQEPFWENNILYRTCITDKILMRERSGGALYQRYFFYKYFNLELVFTPEDLLNELEAVAAAGLLTEIQAGEYLTSLFSGPDNLIAFLNWERRLSDNFYTDLNALNHRYISDTLRKYLSSH